MDEELDFLSQQFYQVNVVLWEGRHLALTNANSKVVVSIGKKKKIMYSKNNKTDCPYYNDFCIFPFRLPLNVLLDKILTIKVYQKSLTVKFIGSFSLELATVWSQPNHQFYHKWAVLADPKNPASGVKGFLKCDIVILAKGVSVKPTEEDGNLLEENLLVPYGGTQDRLRTRIILSVFRADSFSSNFAGKLKLAKPYIKITYGDSVRKTSVAKNKRAPVWNEELTFPDLFPPLMQNIFIEICDRKKSSQKSLGNTTIDIRSLYEDGNDGFLPTFGPNFLYLYQPLKEFQRHKNCCATENSFTYAGRLLLSLRTEVIDKFDQQILPKKKPKKTVPKTIPPLTENMYFRYNKFILFATIFDVLFFDATRAEKKIKIQVKMGPKRNVETSKIEGRKKRIKSTEALKKVAHADSKEKLEPLKKKSHEGLKKKSHEALEDKPQEALEKKPHEASRKKSHEALGKKSKKAFRKKPKQVSVKKSKKTEKKKSREIIKKKSRESMHHKPREALENKPHEALEKKPKKKSHEALRKKSHEALRKKSHEALENKPQEAVEKKSQKALEKKPKKASKKKSHEALRKKSQESLENKPHEAVEKKSQKALEKKPKKTSRKKSHEALRRKSRESLENKPQEAVEKKSQKALEKKPKKTSKKKPKKTSRKKSREALRRKSRESLEKKPKKTSKKKSHESLRKKSHKALDKKPKKTSKKKSREALENKPREASGKKSKKMLKKNSHEALRKKSHETLENKPQEGLKSKKHKVSGKKSKKALKKKPRKTSRKKSHESSENKPQEASEEKSQDALGKKSKKRLKKKPRKTSRKKSKRILKKKSRETLKTKSKKTSKKKSREAFKKKPREASEEQPKEALEEKSQEALGEKSHKALKKKPKKPSKKKSREALGEKSHEALKKKPKKTSKKKSREALGKKPKKISKKESHEALGEKSHEALKKKPKKTSKKKSHEALGKKRHVVSKKKLRADLKKKKHVCPRKRPHSPSEKEPSKYLTVITNCDSTPGQTSTVKEGYGYITFSGSFPCVNIFGEWPNSLKRMYCCNAIKKAIQNCTEEINKIKCYLQFQTDKCYDFSQKLKETLANVSASCENILLLTRLIKLDETNLCRERKKVYHKEIADIAQKIKTASEQKELKAEDELIKISAYLAKLTKYAQDPENSFPSTEIWLLKNNRTVAQQRIRTEDLAFSEDFNYRGVMSGKTQTVIFRGKKGKTIAKLEILIWFGLADDFEECLKILPNGLTQNNPLCSSVPDLKVPSRLICEERHDFQCRMHIYQGKIFFGFDSTGLSDAFVRVIIQGQNKRTEVREKTLSPVWDETLVFSLVTLYGPSEYIEENPPCITVEVFEQETRRKSEVIGRCFVKPLVKFHEEVQEPSSCLPKLRWEPVNSDLREVGQILMAGELLELSDETKDLLYSPEGSAPLPVPEGIRPHNVKYCLEILFWGVRPLKEKKSIKNKVFVIMECGENVIKSPILHNFRHKLNFSGSIQNAELDLPEELEYAPPFNFKLFHIGSMSHKETYVATCLVPSTKYLLLSQTTSKTCEAEEEDKKREKWWKKTKILPDAESESYFSFLMFSKYWKCNAEREVQRISENEPNPGADEETLSWWLKYCTSEENLPKIDESSKIPRIKIYREELEAQPEFGGFQDFLQNYDMVTGHEKKTKGGVLVAKVKAVLKLHRFTEAQEEEKEEGLLSLTAFSNKTLKFVARVYVVCGKNLAARDIYGKSDPYLFLQLGKHTISDRNNYASKQLNPTFGRCFEFQGIFPQDYLLRIKVLDRDVNSRDDLIGETTIDLENRFYSKFHATCGIAWRYERKGFNFWRDLLLPSEILNMLCKQLNLDRPVYTENEVVVQGHAFATPVPAAAKDKREVQSLTVLKKWHEMPFYGFHLVPEHVETRSLYHPSLPGIEQGKLVLWVDIFPADFTSVPPKVDITPQPPVAMELRAIVWNVVDVVLDDKSLLLNGRLSDIYVKGWMLSSEEEMQKTDIHYRSLNGEGNFNWRFIFHFNYIPVERKMTVEKKINVFDLRPEERKIRCKLEIQVWDNDAFGDDFLGTLILELCSMPRGAKLPSRCTLKMLAPNAGKVNLFKIKRTRGWWPFKRLKMKETVDNEFELTGKIDLELEILTKAEALNSPAGKGREEPKALPSPNRPDISANRILNPIKTFRYIFLNRVKKSFILVCISVLTFLFFLVALCAFPNYVVKKLLRA